MPYLSQHLCTVTHEGHVAGHYLSACALIIRNTGDPELKKKADTANEEFRKAMREAIQKADPGLADIIKERMKDRKDGKPGGPPGLANLSEGDRQKLKAAHEKAKGDPAVVAAETLKQNAKTPEERQAAMEQFHKAMKAALLNADPTLAPILDQMKPPQGPPRGTDSKPGE